ncbi:MAG: hypothetical protein AAGC93_21310, partial [Cyanobacteria bacterium P01_F01_bin.53]
NKPLHILKYWMVVKGENIYILKRIGVSRTNITIEPGQTETRELRFSYIYTPLNLEMSDPKAVAYYFERNPEQRLIHELAIKTEDFQLDADSQLGIGLKLAEGPIVTGDIEDYAQSLVFPPGIIQFPSN